MMFTLVLVIRGEVHNNGKPVFLQLEDISHKEGSLQGQQLQYPEKLHRKPTSAQDCSLPCPHHPCLFVHTLPAPPSQLKCCSHHLQENHGFDLGFRLQCYLVVKKKNHHKQKQTKNPTPTPQSRKTLT